MNVMVQREIRGKLHGITSAEYVMKMGRKRFLQYSLNRSVRIGRGKIRVEAKESFFSVKIPTAMACISTSEKIIELCTIGQNFPPVSYLGAYTFKNCIELMFNGYCSRRFNSDTG